MTIHRQIFYAGRVQGVGFRYSVKQIAAGFEVVGWVQNLPDGRVELQAIGQSEEVEAFLAAIGKSHLGRYIKETVRGMITPPLQGWSGFEIRQ